MSFKHHRIRLSKMLFLFQGIICCFLLFSFPAEAQIPPPAEPEIKFTSSLNPVGSGARALAMGGAFIGCADDATAASWNPAGLKNLLRPEISMVINYDHRQEDFSFHYSPGASNQYTISGQSLNYLSLAYPFMWKNRNLVISLNYQNLYSLNRKMQFQWHYEDPNGYVNMMYDVNYRQKGNLKALSPAAVAFLTRNLFFGVTLNFWSDDLYDNGWVEDYDKTGQGIVGGRVYESHEKRMDRYSFSGFNLNLGLLWDINRAVSLGAVVKTPFTARLRHESKSIVHRVWPNEPENNLIEYIASPADDQEMTMPLSYGVGLAVKPFDCLVFDLDIYRIEWDDYMLSDALGNDLNPITGLPKGDSSIKPTHHIRLGGECVFIHKKITIAPRLGIFYDPEPAEGSPDDFYGFGLGAGLTFGPFAVDWAYQFRFGKNVEGDSIKGENSSADVKQHLFYTSMIWYF